MRFSREEDTMRQALVRAVRSRGVDVVTALEAGILERRDAPHLEYAPAQGRVV
jgi:non-canonical (house-cleaning) NTP pyrophosphatase